MAAELFAGISGPIVTAILAGLGVAFREWRKQRSLELRSKEFLSRANEQMTFLESWLRLYEQVGEEANKKYAHDYVEHEIMRLYSGVSSTIDHGARIKPSVGVGSTLKKIFVLNSPFTKASGVLLYLSYYFFLLVAVAVVVASSVSIAQSFTAADVFAGLVMTAIFGAGPVGSIRIIDYWVATRSRRA